MDLSFHVAENNFIDLCVKNASREDTTIARDIYDALIYSLGSSVDKKLNVTEIKFSSVHSDDHLPLVDYIRKGFIEFCYPEMDIYSEKENPLDIEKVILPNFMQLVGINYGRGVIKKIFTKKHPLKTKNRLTIRLLNLRIGRNVLNKMRRSISASEAEILLPTKLKTWDWLQTYYNKFSGEVYLCECFRKALNKYNCELQKKYNSGFFNAKFFRTVNSENHLENREYAQKYNSGIQRKFKENICDLCNNKIPLFDYCAPMYGSPFKVKFGAYIKKTAIENEIDERTAENILREKRGIAKIGEKWINESLLFKYIEFLFSGHIITREASPRWLGKQRLDIYIESLMLGIEYQGEQHFKAIELFGGQEGLKCTQARDQVKREKCKANNVNLIYFTYKDTLSEDLIVTRLKNYLKKK